MIQTGLQSKIKVQDLVESQLPNFIFDDSPNAVEFLKQYYISQEYQGGPIDISDNIDEYLKLSNLNDSIIFDDATLTGAINSEDTIIEVSSTKGFPNKYGLLKIDDEIITYTGITTNSFTGCIRGFSGVTNYHQDLNREELVFSTSTSSEHSDKSSIKNLSTLFLKDFYKKLKFTFAPGFENIPLTKGLDVGNFIRRVRDFYKSKGTEESVRILFKVIFGEDASVVNLENYLIKPSSANYLRREIVVAESISGNPLNIKGQTIFKSTDLNTNASISEIEPFSANGKTYYTLQIYIGNNLESSVQGNFAITPNTKLLESVSVGSSILNVDSTLDFPEFGTLTSGNSSINYTGKTINQFFGCTGVNNIDATSNIISSDTYFSYEDGDTSKKVELILHGKIDNIMKESDEFIVGEGDKFSIKNIGDKINNTGKNWKEIFANSFIYNTTTRYEILDNNNITLSSTIDRSSLKIGDEVEILERNSEISAHSINQSSYIQTIDVNNNSLGLKNTPSLDQNKKYDIRRKLNKANSSGYNFESSSLLSDVINLYTDNDEYAYVASNSFPSEIRSDFKDLNNKVIENYRFDVESTIKSTSINSISNLSDFDADKQLYSSITVDSLPFITGDRILYDPESEPLIGLSAGSYYIENLGNQKFKLYKSLSFIESDLYETFFIPPSGVGNDRFILFSQSDEVFGIQKLLKKIPLEKNIKNGSGQNTLPGKTGILINGVEINNYKSEDVIYYGPIKDVNILSSGENYDVINPPLVEVSVGLGSTAKINPVVSGSLEKVYVDSQNYDIDKIVSVDIIGGNGSGASIEPVLIKRSRDVSFNSNELSLGGGVNVATNQILFFEEHNFSNGEEIIYDPLNNSPIKISVGSTFIDLPKNSSYFAQVDNNKSITLYNSLEDQISKVNPVGIFSGSFGDHKFSTLSLKKQVAFAKVIEGGSNYTNRKLIVKSSGISTTKNTINFKNHGFNDGEIIEYSYDDTQISGITTNNQYKVIKIDNDSFRLSNTGIGGTITSNYERKKYELLESTGNGYQYFKYPDISVSIKYTPVGVGSTTQEYNELITTPVVRGSIIDAYVYESGTGYGSTILNFNKKPIISIKNGNNAEIIPKIANGKIADVSINFSDNEYFSVPDLIVSGDGSGAELRAIIDEGKITDVKILNTGIGYSSTNTIIKVISAGNGLIIDPNIRKLTINDNEVRFNGGEVLLKGKDKLQYSVSKYFGQLRSIFLEDNSLSGIIGWAYDGNPIYGPFGYSDPKDKFSEVKKLKSGYETKVSNVEDRPSGFFNGFFVEDYEFNNNGDLDEYNGRYEVNDEFPNGVYAYHATNNTFPYFIGNKYKSELISDSNLDQSFDFKNSNLLRNTFPYRVSEINSNYDFIIQSNDIINQTIEVLSATSGPIESLVVENSGSDYKVGDVINFDETNTSGSGLNVNVSSIKGKDITELNTTSSSYPNSIFTWESSKKVRVSILPIQNLSNNDYVLVSGFSTNLSELNGFHKIEVPEYSQGRCLSTINSSGITTEIYVSPISISNVLSLGSSIGIGTETLKVIGIFVNQNIIRVRRGSPGTIHNVGSAVSFFPDSFLISKSVDNFESSLNDRVFFNPKESVGISTINGVGYSTSFVFGDVSVTRDIPSKGIFIEKHPFKTNQSIIYTPNGTNVSVSTDGSSTFNLPSNLFVVSKNNNVIGLKTSISSPELFFHTNGDDNDEYKFESNFTQILGDIDKNVVTVSVSTSHELQNGDTVTLDVQPNLSVGIGTSTAVRVLYKSQIDNIVVNPIGFNSTGINTVTDEITIANHELVTGDKVLYEDDNFEYLIETSDQLDTSSQDNGLQSLRFKPDGTKMYALGSASDEVNEYALSTPWSPSTAVFTNKFDVTSEDTKPSGLYIREDGLKFWITGNDNDTIYQYSMTSAWDITTASYDNVSLFIGSSNSIDGFSSQISPTGLYFKYDGSVLYLIGSTGDFIYQFNLSTSWDITTASYSGDSTGRIDLNPPDAAPSDIHINSSGTLVYFVGAGSDNFYIYKLSTPWDIVTGTELDRIDLGTSITPTSIYVSPDEENFYAGSSGDDIIRRFIRPSPLTNSEYYVYKINRNRINLCETLIDSQQNPPTVVSFASTGSSSQSISLINPQLQPVKNNNLVFDLSDSSLSGYEFKLYTDEKFNNEFVSTGSTDTFSVSGVGTVGVTSTASLTLNYTTQIPEELFYTLVKDGELVTSDTDTKNYSRIIYVNSDYNNSYVIGGIGETTFNINLQKKPEKISYSSEECDILEYSTTSTSPSGPVKNLNIISSGSGYKKFPTIRSTNSSSGKNLKVNLRSSKLGSIRETRIINDNFIYSSDTTLRPKANISPTIKLKNSKTINDNIVVINGGNGYVTEPNLIIVDSVSRNVINSGFIKPLLSESSIFSAEVVVKPKGLPDGNVEIISINNSNGISIEKVESSNSGIFTCTISTPINFGSSDFTSQPFSIGDSVFVEGVIKDSSEGDGFNSSDYGYKFFKVSDYDNTGVNDRVTIDISDITSNTGIAKTDQFFTSSIINKNDYPLFDFSKEELNFSVGEKLSSNGIIRDLIVSESNSNNLKVSGLYKLSVGEIIVGEDSGTIATIESINSNNAIFDVKYSYLKNIGWDNDTGKLSENFQVIADNNYYQNLSYSIKSPITYRDQQSPVENLVHISGLKNFADTQIQKNTSAGLSTSTNTIAITKNIIDKKYAYTINNFDKVLDVDVNDSKSKFLKFKNTILSDYIELKNTLNVLKIDDISNQFLTFANQNQEFFTIEQLKNETYYNFLLRVTSDDDTKVQLTDVTILSNDKGTFISDNESVVTSGSTNLNFEIYSYGSFDLNTDEISGNTELVFKPNDKITLNSKYFIKLIKKTFENTGSTGIHTDRESIGFIDLIASDVIESSSVGVGTTTIISLDSNSFESVYINSQVIDKVTSEMEYVRLYIVHNGVDTFLSEYYSDTSLISSSSSGIGTFYANLDSGILSVSHENNSPNSIEIKSRIVGFGTTSSGIGTYRFEATGQLFDGSERSAIYDSNYTSTVSAASTTINTLDKNTFNTSKSLVQVSIGSTKVLHQIIIAHDGTDVYTQQLPFLSAFNNDSSGIGTFGGEISGDNAVIKFYPDADKTGQIEIEVFNEKLYTELDTASDYLNLNYGSIVEKIDEKTINPITIKSGFILKNNETPIFSKEFNPNSVALAATTGIFTIENHFFRTGEELIYTPDTTFFGIGSSSISTPSGDLPSTVYAIKLTEDTFKIATSLTDAQSGIGTTFTSIGGGNAHKFTMKERNSKCIITIDDLIQYPLAFTKIKHDLIGNVGGQVELDTNIISLSGISTIVPNDILLVDDEYMKVVNVGFGTTNLGPITNNGNINLVEVDRGFVGSSASTHLDSSIARVYKGSFNIVDSRIYFSELPLEDIKSDINLSLPKSSFTGRVFLKSNYLSNKIYDDLSDEFTGIGRTFSLRVGGANTTGIGTIGGNGFILVNDSYQSPKTANNPNVFNYNISENLVSGISSITFSGISNPNNPLEYITSDYDVNLNDLPRGGIIVSYGSSPGLGFAPLVGASVTSVVGAGGSIVSVGIGTTDNLGSGYNGLVSIGISVFEEGHVGEVASISASIGVGGTLSFNVGSGGTGYTNPKIFVSDPSYENLPIVGVFRSGIGNTTESGSGLLVDVELGGSTGIGSTYFEVNNFKFSRSGFNFKKGDIFKPIGLVTDSSLSSPISDFTITVEDVYTDNFAGWEFGELDFLDSIKQLQDGSRTRFPIFYNGELISFETESGSEIENNISNLLIIFINGILQEPMINYQFEGGTSFLFTEAPKPEDVIDVYFYKGVGNIDTEFVEVTSTLKNGDILQVKSSNLHSDISTQDERNIYNIKFSDKLETNKYSGLGINEVKFRPISWTKQKTSKKINGQFTYKTRDSLEPLIFPTSRIIKDISTTDTEIFVDNSELFGYETDTPGFGDDSLPFNAIVINGISTEASGSIESITEFSNISGFSGIITGITTTTGIGGNSLALKFEIHDSNSTPFSGISTGYPIYIYDTQIGTGVTSIDSSDSAIVGIGTTFLDNIYYISDWSNINNIGILTCNVKSDSNIIGINTNGNILNPIGKYSWGRLSGGTRSSNPISIGVTGKIVSGLSTYPTIQRRGIGIRKTGALPKIVL